MNGMPFDEDMDGFRPKRSNLIEPDIPKKESDKAGKNIAELILGDDDIKSFARKYNLDPDMSEKILVPLLSLLDKYGVGESITASPQVESATNAFQVIRDVAPIVKGAAEYISGRRAELEEEDLAFLHAIKESQKINDTSLFDDDDELFSVGESVNQTPQSQQTAPPPPMVNFHQFAQNDWGDFWAEATGANEEPAFVNNELTAAMEEQQKVVNQWAMQESAELRDKTAREQTGGFLSLGDGAGGDFDMVAALNKGMADTFAASQETNFSIIDVDELARESGLSMNEVAEGDSQRKINNERVSDTTQSDYTVNIEEFIEPETASQIDYDLYEIPESAKDYDPLHITGYEVPEMDIDPNEFKEFLEDIEPDAEEADDVVNTWEDEGGFVNDSSAEG